MENSKYDVGPFYIQLSSCKDNEGASNSAEEDDVDQEEGRSHLLYNNSDDSDQGDYDLADDYEDDDGETDDRDDDGDDEDGKMIIMKTSPVVQQL